jgi:hypothetical protein
VSGKYGRSYQGRCCDFINFTLVFTITQSSSNLKPSSLQSLKDKLSEKQKNRDSQQLALRIWDRFFILVDIGVHVCKVRNLHKNILRNRPGQPASPHHTSVLKAGFLSL